MPEPEYRDGAFRPITMATAFLEIVFRLIAAAFSVAQYVNAMQHLSHEERRNDIYKNTFRNIKCVFYFSGAIVASIGTIFDILLIMAAAKRNQRMLYGWLVTPILDLIFIIILACFLLAESRWQIILFITLASVFKFWEFGIVIALNAEIVNGKKRLLYEQIPEEYYGFKPRAKYSLIGMASVHDHPSVVRKPGTTFLNAVRLHSADEFIIKQQPLYTVTTIHAVTTGSRTTDFGDPVVES